MSAFDGICHTKEHNVIFCELASKCAYSSNYILLIATFENNIHFDTIIGKTNKRLAQMNKLLGFSTDK